VVTQTEYKVKTNKTCQIPTDGVMTFTYFKERVDSYHIKAYFKERVDSYHIKVKLLWRLRLQKVAAGEKRITHATYIRMPPTEKYTLAEPRY
jgi:hypothetical protein